MTTSLTQLLTTGEKQIREFVDRSPFLCSTPIKLQVRARPDSAVVLRSGTVLPIQVHKSQETGQIMNLMFEWVDESSVLKVDVPVVFKGEDACPGLKKAHSISPFEQVEEMESSLEEDYEIMAHFVEQGFDDPSFNVPVWPSAAADSSSSYCYYYQPEIENFSSNGGFCAAHFEHGDGFYLNKSDAIPQISEPAICVTAIGDLARFSEDVSSDDIEQPVPPPQDPAICVTAVGDLAQFSGDASSNGIGQPVPPPQDPMKSI